MSKPVFSAPMIITEEYIDSLGHVNNAMYLTLYEKARWDLISNNGYDLKQIKATGLGPVILEINLKFMQEIRLSEEIIIESVLLSYEGKIGKLQQKILRKNEVCSLAEFVFGLFDLQQRKLVLPTPAWLKAVGMAD